jgi:endo-1,4-beta-xylanase
LNDQQVLTRRSFLLGVAGAAAAGLVACSGGAAPRRFTPPPTGTSAPGPSPLDCAALDAAADPPLPLWKSAMQRGIVYGSSTATWQISDTSYRALYEREAAILFTEDDLLWYRLKPTPESDLDFTYGDQIIEFAEKQGMMVFGAHLVWDDGFGDGWTHKDLWEMDAQAAGDLILGTVDSVVRRYRGRVAGWSVANEVLNGSGQRTDVPWYATIGPSYVADSFHAAHDADPDALLVLNDFGYETDDGFASADGKRAATLQFLDELLGAKVPVHALGVQAHLSADGFASRFDPAGYGTFLSEVAGRGLKILITEMDVLDDGLPAKASVRDQAIADVLGWYLDVALAEPAVFSLMTFGLSDRYTWLQEDYPRNDGAPRRPLPFDDSLKPKPEFDALKSSLEQAAARDIVWLPPRC